MNTIFSTSKASPSIEKHVGIVPCEKIGISKSGSSCEILKGKFAF